MRQPQISKTMKILLLPQIKKILLKFKKMKNGKKVQKKVKIKNHFHLEMNIGKWKMRKKK